MCLWSPWASLQRVLLCLSSSISVLPWQQFFFFHLYALPPSSLIPFLPISLSISVYFCFFLSFICHQSTVLFTHTNMYVWECSKCICAQTYHANAYKCMLYEGPWKHRLTVAGCFLHNKTLRICRGAPPISGAQWCAVDFWRGRYSTMTKATEIHPSAGTRPFSKSVFCGLVRYRNCICKILMVALELKIRSFLVRRKKSEHGPQLAAIV